MLTAEFGFKIFSFYLPLLLALCVHEWAHAWMAEKKGDLTAFHAGRLTLNPLAHMDILGTLILPFFFMLTNSSIFFGWAKPVPVDERNLKNPKNDMFWVAFAGPLSNMIMALIGIFILAFAILFQNYSSFISQYSYQMITNFIYINLFLCFFNLIPLHPLDGGQILGRFLPFRWQVFMQENQYYFSIGLLILVFSGGFYYFAKPIITLGNLFVGFSKFLSEIILLFL